MRCWSEGGGPIYRPAMMHRGGSAGGFTPRAQIWHATACWRALGHFRRVPHILGVAGSVSSRCVLVRALAGQGGQVSLVLSALICGTN